jgi:hypothetical protein
MGVWWFGVGGSPLVFMSKGGLLIGWEYTILVIPMERSDEESLWLNM